MITGLNFSCSEVMKFLNASGLTLVATRLIETRLERPMKENSIHRAVREGRAALGTGLKEFTSRGVPWIIEASGFDFVAIDHEHGAFDLETIANLAGWFQATSVSPIVRIHKSFNHLIPGILDQGIMGIQVSEVETAAEARAIVQLAKFPPIGNRGISGQGMHTGYKSYGARHATEYAPWANANIIVCSSIESLEGLEQVEASGTAHVQGQRALLGVEETMETRAVGIRFVEVPEEEYPTLGCNVLAVRPGVVIVADGNPLTRQRLEAAGCEVHAIPLGEIGQNGSGGPTCLTRPILRG